MKKFVKETSKKLATGALAILATIGSTSLGAFADEGDTSQLPANKPTGTTTIAGATSTGWTSGDELDLGEGAAETGTIPVKGFQTSKVYNYELKVSWGNMKFVFDRGQYNPATNRLTKKLAGDSVYQYCEAGVDSGEGVSADDTTGMGVGKWCGFDGTNNRVDVENLGNGNINMIVGCAESSAEAAGEPSSTVDMQVAVITDELDNGTSDENWILVDPDSSARTTAEMQTGEGYTSSMTIGKGSNSIASAIIQKKFALDGTPANGASQDDVNSVRFYLNITGTPNPQQSGGIVVAPTSAENASILDVITEVPSTDAAWENIGDITLSFKGVAETETASGSNS